VENKFLNPVQMVAPAPLPFVLGIGLNKLFTTYAHNGRGLIFGFNKMNKMTLAAPPSRAAKIESSEVTDILLPVPFYFNPSTRLDNVKKPLTIRY